ncbi:MAG: flagellar hook-associated protein FlgK [Rickettsiales bacterium]
MSLALALNNSLTGLNINRQSLAVLSQNISNANTEGYSRKIVNQESIYLDGQGAGVRIEDVVRKVDDYLIRSINQQTSEVGKGDTLSDYAERIQILLGKPGERNSVDANISSFFNSVQSLAQTPENSSLRINAINLGKTLSGRMSDLSLGLDDLRFQADQDISLMISSINSAIVEIDKLNTSISNESALGRSVAELEDKRDLLVKDLSQYMEIQIFKKSNGEINISSANGFSILDDSVYELSYSAAGAVTSFVNNASLAPIQIYRLDEVGNRLGTPRELVTSGTPDSIVSGVGSGKLAGLIDIRDKQIPEIIAQLDNISQVLRDQVNAVHNSGSGYPGANSYTGTHSLVADDYSQWGGKIRIAVLGDDGRAIASRYGDEDATRPLTIDLSTLDYGLGEGQPTIQGIIDEINRSFGVPQNKVEVGNINNINLVSNVDDLPGFPPQFNFDFSMENISADKADVFVTNVEIRDSTNTLLAAPISTAPTIALAGNYNTVAGSKVLTVNTTGVHNLKDGDKVYLSPPSSAIDGIPTNNFDQLFTVSNVQAGSFDVVVSTAASTGGNFVVAGQTAIPKYSEVPAGEITRTKNDGTFTADLSSNPTSSFYTVNVKVAVDDGTGNISNSIISYRVNNNTPNIRNLRYAATAATADGKIVPPASLQPVVRALLVDKDGVELAKNNGIYTTSKEGFLKIEAMDSDNYIAIDSMDSVELGRPNDTPKVAATNRSFAHYLGLNNFFVDDGDERTIKTSGSAFSLNVEQRLIDNPNLISLGNLVQTTVSSTSDKPPPYTYERNIGDNSVIQKLAKLGIDAIDFKAVSGLGQTSKSFTAYAGQIIGAAATKANIANTEKDNAQSLLDGFEQRSDSISGVNLDEELANTIVFQNSYSASARIITVVSTLFDTLIQAVN